MNRSVIGVTDLKYDKPIKCRAVRWSGAPIYAPTDCRRRAEAVIGLAKRDRDATRLDHRLEIGTSVASVGIDGGMA